MSNQCDDILSRQVMMHLKTLCEGMFKVGYLKPIMLAIHQA